MIYVRSCCHRYEGEYLSGVFSSIAEASSVGDKVLDWKQSTSQHNDGITPVKVWESEIDSHTCYFLFAYGEENEFEEEETD